MTDENYYAEDQGRPVCSGCNGTGMVYEVGGTFPNDYSVPCGCPGCGGSGLGREIHEPFRRLATAAIQIKKRNDEYFNKLIKIMGQANWMEELERLKNERI